MRPYLGGWSRARLAQRSRRDAAGGLEGGRTPWTITAAGGGWGNRNPPTQPARPPNPRADPHPVCGLRHIVGSRVVTVVVPGCPWLPVGASWRGPRPGWGCCGGGGTASVVFILVFACHPKWRHGIRELVSL